MPHRLPRQFRATLRVCAVAILAASGVALRAQDPGRTEQASVQFGGNYSELDARRQKLVENWVARFNAVAGAKIPPDVFYDTKIKLSSKTTFDAITNALVTTPLTDESGQRFGDTLDIIEQVDMVRGQVIGQSGDQQFRMYVQLKEDALSMLDRSREFRRAADNTVYHRGYPINYRQRGGNPSIQVSIALDRRRADVDVDYRAGFFPVSIFNGHLTTANSDVRAGGNYDRHANRWAGFQNWWRSVFGVRVAGAPAAEKDTASQFFPEKPRIGDKTIDFMMEDFLKAWLIERDAVQAMGYVSERCVRMPDGRRRRSAVVRPRHGAVAHVREPEGGERGAWPAYLARRPHGRRPSECSRTQGRHPEASPTVCDLRGSRRHRRQVRL